MIDSLGTLQVSYIPQPVGLDAISVFWQDFGPSQGAVTITCFGSAWTTYFGAMHGLTIKEFFLDVGVQYLVNKMGYTQLLKQRKKDLDYLYRIIVAIRAAEMATSMPAHPTIAAGGG